MVPAFRVGVTSAFYIVLVVFVVYGTAHLFAASHPDAKFSKVLVGLGF